MQQVNNPELPPLVAAELQAAQRAPRGIALSTMLVIGCSLVLSVIGQALLKYGMGQMGPLSINVASLPQIAWQIAISPYVIGGLLVYGVATFFWLITLSRSTSAWPTRRSASPRCWYSA